MLTFAGLGSGRNHRYHCGLYSLYEVRHRPPSKTRRHAHSKGIRLSGLGKYSRHKIHDAGGEQASFALSETRGMPSCLQSGRNGKSACSGMEEHRGGGAWQQQRQVRSQTLRQCLACDCYRSSYKVYEVLQQGSSHKLG